MLKVRKAGLEDIPSVVEMWKEFVDFQDSAVLESNLELEPYIKKKANAEDGYRDFLREKLSEEGAVLLAEHSGKPVGYMLVFSLKEVPIFELEKVGMISDLFVREGFRGQKISSMLKDEAFKWFRENGVEHVTVPAQYSNARARTIYRKWGFMDYKVQMRRKI